MNGISISGLVLTAKKIGKLMGFVDNTELMKYMNKSSIVLGCLEDHPS